MGALSEKAVRKARTSLPKYYLRLYERLGPQGWWPARTRLEVILGSILTQNTSWRNVEKALRSLRVRGWLRLSALCRVEQSELAPAIRSAGFYRQKAATIRNFLAFLESKYGNSFGRMFRQPMPLLREQLLQIKGFGLETVDTILLYAGRHPSFVVDAYTRRILERHELASPEASYNEIQMLFHQSLNPDTLVFNEYHALLVETGKRFCKRGNPDCRHCPLEAYLPSRPLRRAVPTDSAGRPAAPFRESLNSGRARKIEVRTHG